MALVAAACGGADGDSTFTDDANQTGGDGGDEGSLLGGDTGNVDPFGDAIVPPDALTACAADTQQAKQLPLDLYIMQDTSGSMANLVAPSQSKWDAIKAAITAFVQDPQSAGIGVGLQFFPLPKAGVPAACTSSAQCGTSGPCLLNICVSPNQTQLIACNTKSDCPGGNSQCLPAGQCSIEKNVYCAQFGASCGNDANGYPRGTCQQITTSSCVNGDSCTATDYSTPAVAISALPGGAAGIVGALGAKGPEQETPTSAALQGAVNEAKTYAGANAGHTVVAVLATDGLPSECDTNIGNIAGIASAAVAGAPSVKTFVIGIFTTNEASTAKPNLDQIAAAGGTSQAFIVNAGQNAEQQFLAALNTIRGSALPCEYTLPVPDGGTPDYGKVNVEFTEGNGTKVVLPYTETAGNCGTTGGWYYDVDPKNGGTPTKVEICPTTCATMKADPNGRVDVLQGCKTVTVVK
jgi:hypothetical protein